MRATVNGDFTPLLRRQQVPAWDAFEADPANAAVFNTPTNRRRLLHRLCSGSNVVPTERVSPIREMLQAPAVQWATSEI